MSWNFRLVCSLLLVLLIASSLHISAYAWPERVWTDKSVYNYGETINIYFSVSGADGEFILSYVLGIVKPDGTYDMIQLGALSKGTHVYSIIAGPPTGIRRVYVAPNVGGGFAIDYQPPETSYQVIDNDSQREEEQRRQEEERRRQEEEQRRREEEERQRQEEEQRRQEEERQRQEEEQRLWEEEQQRQEQETQQTIQEEPPSHQYQSDISRSPQEKATIAVGGAAVSSVLATAATAVASKAIGGVALGEALGVSGVGIAGVSAVPVLPALSGGMVGAMVSTHLRQSGYSLGESVAAGTLAGAATSAGITAAVAVATGAAATGIGLPVAAAILAGVGISLAFSYLSARAVE